MNETDHLFCVAPMMAWTDRHARYFLRLISRHTRLYTEMLTADAVRFGDRHRLLDFDIAEHPLALQLGGNEPSALADAAAIGVAWGYDEINLNIGCPSSRVQSGAFGAALMRTPQLVGDCVDAIYTRLGGAAVPVTIKCRLGVDEQDSHEALFSLIEACYGVGVRHFVVHARKAWLAGLSPKDNRDIPPLDYGLVYAAKRAYGDCCIVINGGIGGLGAVAEHLTHVDGVMLGRAAYKTPYLLAEVDRVFFGAESVPSREAILDAFMPYVEAQLAAGVRLHAMTRHILGLYAGCRGGKKWRQVLSLDAYSPRADAGLLRNARPEFSVAQSVYA